MDSNRKRLLKEVMDADFNVIELNLYLDTHPYDQRALSMYNNKIQQAVLLRGQYEKMYGPLTAFNSYSSFPWKWIESPWPWEKFEEV